MNLEMNLNISQKTSRGLDNYFFWNPTHMAFNLVSMQ